MSTIEELNYLRDPRNCDAAKPPVLSFYGCGNCGTPGESCDCPDDQFHGCYIEEPLPIKWGVCPVCEGRGKHVNPSIDCGGIGPEAFAEDPDFAADYFGGTYDQTCNRCNGRTTIQVVDWGALTDGQRTAYEKQLQDEADDRACCLAEMRMGA